MAWSDGYFTELTYTHGYYPELNPAMLRLACLCHGVDPHLGETPTYLELGFGQGVSINIHAAASGGSYWGTDFNPAQTASARKLALASGAEIRLFDESFEEFAERDNLPDFDIIALHGIWSWVSDTSRGSSRTSSGGSCGPAASPLSAIIACPAGRRSSRCAN